ncbi:hypothetical protein AMJ49_04440 [Parcubacteria bacterium DG_74_2]|nr:MAG: hypothetical protein AMJ49_04440 [Parcubacteria bacterium DG_74_2]
MKNSNSPNTVNLSADAKLISVVVPVYNEEENIPLIYSELIKALHNLEEDYDYEIIFVNDGSNDNSDKVIQDLTNYNPKVKYIEFSRNFGKEIATSAGIHNAAGNAAIIADADLQHPPRFIPEFLDKWEKGADIVVGIRKNNRKGLIKRMGAFWFYKIMNRIGETYIIPNATDYRLLDRKVIEEFNRFTERNRITRGLLDWLGFKRDFVYFNVAKRNSGKAGYSYFKLTKLALSTFITHSLFFLKLAGYLGIIITPLSGFMGLFILIEKYVLNDPFGLAFTGTAMLAVMIIFLVGIILICLGLVALYIGNIQNEVANRPMYVIRKKKNLE